MTIKDTKYKLQYTIRALLIYEQITGKVFSMNTITDEYLFFYCLLIANNPDMQLTFDELIDCIDEDMNLMLEFHKFLEKEMERQKAFIIQQDDAKKKS